MQEGEWVGSKWQASTRAQMVSMTGNPALLLVVVSKRQGTHSSSSENENEHSWLLKPRKIACVAQLPNLQVR